MSEDGNHDALSERTPNEEDGADQEHWGEGAKEDDRLEST